MDGLIELTSEELQMSLDGQDLQGNLKAELVIAGGVPREMKVDLSGSTLTLDKISVAGKRETFDEDYWSAGFKLDRAEAVLHEPYRFNGGTRLKISDTRPLVAFFENRIRSPRWFSRLLTLKDLEGEGAITIDGDRMDIPTAQLISDKAEVAAKAVISPGNRDGMIYARYKKLDVLLKMEDGKNNLDIYKTREKFDAYRVSGQ
jgi:hypothetical protein